MSQTMTNTDPSGLPDPQLQSEFYEGVTAKRLFAWLIDTVVVFVIAAAIASLPFFLGWFFFGLIFLVANAAYRITTITSRSSTWGMRLSNIELRNRHGQKFEGSEAVLHTVVFMLASAFFLPQLVSMLLMIFSEKRQGLHDLLIGSAMINSPTRF